MAKKKIVDTPEYPADAPFEAVKVRGFFRVQITNPDGTVAGDSGYKPNVITNLGFNQYLVSALGSIAGSKYVSHAALGTTSSVNATDTALGGEVAKRQAVTAATSSSSKTVRFTATFDSANSFLAGTSNISVVGLFNSSSGGTLFAGNTYASSSCATNQNVNITYDIIFS